MSKHYDLKNVDTYGLSLALKEAQTSVDEGGIPIGSALILFDSTDPNGIPRLLGSGHNQRIQKSSAVLHGEMAALEDAGRLKAEVYRKSTIVSEGELNCFDCLYSFLLSMFFFSVMDAVHGFGVIVCCFPSSRRIWCWVLANQDPWFLLPYTNTTCRSPTPPSRFY